MIINNISRFFPNEKIKFIFVEIAVINSFLRKNLMNIFDFVKQIELKF